MADNDPNPEPEPEPEGTPEPTPSRRGRQREPKVFSEEEVEAIRQEEKQKLYPRLQKVDELEATVAELRQTEAERQKAIDREAKAAEKATQKKQEEEMELRDLIAKKDGEWEQKLEEERQERGKIMALLEKEQAHAALQGYLAQRMVEEAENIMPELHYTVYGNSPEEIDASIERAKATTLAIVNNVNSTMQGQRAGQRGAAITGPPVGPMEMAATTTTLTADDLKAMTPEDYATHREALLREAGKAYRAR
jgi:hypothetical protein